MNTPLVGITRDLIDVVQYEKAQLVGDDFEDALEGWNSIPATAGERREWSCNVLDLNQEMD